MTPADTEMNGMEVDEFGQPGHPAQPQQQHQNQPQPQAQAQPQAAPAQPQEQPRSDEPEGPSSAS